MGVEWVCSQPVLTASGLVCWGLLAVVFFIPKAWRIPVRIFALLQMLIVFIVKVLTWFGA